MSTAHTRKTKGIATARFQRKIGGGKMVSWGGWGNSYSEFGPHGKPEKKKDATRLQNEGRLLARTTMVGFPIKIRGGKQKGLPKTSHKGGGKL